MKITNSIIILIAVFFSSCTITQEYTFNKDFSGSAKLSLDIASFMDMMEGMDSTGTSTAEMQDSLDFVFKESAQKLDSVGVKNIQFGWEKNSKILFMSYDFKDLEELNKALNASNTQNAAVSKSISKEPHVYFTKKGKKTLMYSGPKSDKDVSDNKDMESMKDYYKYAVIFKFKRKIKKIDNPNVTLSSDNKQAELKGSMFEIIRPEYNSDIIFKLK
jgi:hypothetical protein